MNHIHLKATNVGLLLRYPLATAGILVLLTMACVCKSLANSHSEKGEFLDVPLIERMAEHSESRVIYTRTVGTIKSVDTRGSVIALILENPRFQPANARGVRLEFANKATSVRIYIDGNDLPLHLQETNNLDCFVATMSQEKPAFSGTHGIARCAPSNGAQRFCPGYYREPGVQGFSLSIREGGVFRFPSLRPSAFAELLDQAISDLNIKPTTPGNSQEELSEADQANLFASALRQFPELEGSKGIKASGYRLRNRKAAWAIFWPYRQEGEMGHSYFMDCKVEESGARTWRCDWHMPRGYLSLPDQDFKVVIIGVLEKTRVEALVTLARKALADDPLGDRLHQFDLVSIMPPSEYSQTKGYDLTWSNGVDESITVKISDSVPGSAKPYKFDRIAHHKLPECGQKSYPGIVMP